VVKITPCRLVKVCGRYGGIYCLHLGLLALKMKGETSQMTWIFTNTAVRISPPPTVVPKRRQETTNRRCVKSQKNADLIDTPFVAWNHATVEVVSFLLSAGCFLCAVHMYAGHFRYMKIIPQQVKGKKKWAEIHHLLRLFVMWWIKAEHPVYA